MAEGNKSRLTPTTQCGMLQRLHSRTRRAEACVGKLRPSQRRSWRLGGAQRGYCWRWPLWGWATAPPP
eukprot:13285371-Alexandrium_andersonii.AAC.1